MSKTKNVKTTKRAKTWILFALLAVILWYVTANVFVKFGTLVTVFGYALTICVAALAVCSFFGKLSISDLLKETEEEKLAREERKARKRAEREAKDNDDAIDVPELEPECDVEVAETPEDTPDTQVETPETEDNDDDEDEEIADEGDEADNGKFAGYRIGDVLVNVPVTCFSNFIGPVSKAIKSGKVELSHGLILDDNNVIHISLNEMVKYGYKVPTGYRLNSAHDTLVPSASVIKYDGNGRYKAEAPDGFTMILEGECAGEFVPLSMELIANL